MYISAPKMYILTPEMYILTPEMYILTPEIYILRPKKGTKAGCTFSKGILLNLKGAYWYLNGTY